MRVVCLGEALVDLICEHPVEQLTDAEAFVPHTGGALANVASVAALSGGDVVLAGGAGDDPWGNWLQQRLSTDGVDLSLWSLHSSARTPVAFVTVNERHQPNFVIYGREVELLFEHLEAEEVVKDAGCLVIGSNTLTGPNERALTLRASQLANELGTPVIFDPNLRPDRWRDDDDEALKTCRKILATADIVKLSAEESVWLGDVSEPETAAANLSRRGFTVVLTLGERGANLYAEGEQLTYVTAPTVATVDTTGAGDVLLGYLLAKFTGSTESLEAALPRAVELAAHSTTCYGATSCLADLL